MERLWNYHSAAWDIANTHASASSDMTVDLLNLREAKWPVKIDLSNFQHFDRSKYLDISEEKWAELQRQTYRFWYNPIARTAARYAYPLAARYGRKLRKAGWKL